MSDSVDLTIIVPAYNEEGSIESAFVEAVPVIEASTPLTEMLEPVAESPHPVPVVDANRRYLGTVSRSALLHARHNPDVFSKVTQCR